MMACDKTTKLLISCYADGELTHEEEARAREHLEHCSDCRKLLEEWNGQRRIFEWAYAIELPEETEPLWLEKLSERENHMSISERISRIPVMIHKRSWGWAAAAVVLFFVIYYIATMPKFLKMGTAIATQNLEQSARMENNIQLKLGPNSRIFRIDRRTIRLEKGWINASVRNGSGLRILAKRIEVTDQGTEFKVGTGVNVDYVVVKEGMISVSKGNKSKQVNAGQMLIAKDKGDFWLTTMPKQDNEVRGWMSLDERTSNFQPMSAQRLDLDAGLQRLASRFPDVMWEGNSSSGYDESNGLLSFFSIGTLKGYKNGLRDHFTDIALASAGEKIDAKEWEIPIMILQVSGIASTPELPNDVYYVQLVSIGNGELVWRLRGSMGNEADYPFTAGKLEIEDNKNRNLFCSMGEGSYGPFEWQQKSLLIENERKTIFHIRLRYWPVEPKPLLEFRLRYLKIAEYQKDRLSMIEEIARQTPALKNIDLKNTYPELLYLNRNRKHRFMIIWNQSVLDQLCQIANTAKQGHGESITIGVMATDAPLEEPKAEKGVYLLRFVFPNNSKSPHLEISTPDGRKIPSWGAASCILRKVKDDDYKGGRRNWSPESSPNYNRLHFENAPMNAENGAFPFQLEILGSRVYSNYSIFAGGWIRVKQP